MNKFNRAAYMMLTHREGYSLDDGSSVGTKTAQKLIGLFSADMPVQRKNGPTLTPNDDGLFPGHSQTWRVVR